MLAYDRHFSNPVIGCTGHEQCNIWSYSQGTDSSKGKHFQLSVLCVKLWHQEDRELNVSYHSLYSFKFIQSKAQIDPNCFHFLAITLYPT